MESIHIESGVKEAAESIGEGMKNGGLALGEDVNPGQTSTVINDRIRRNTVIYGGRNGRIRSFTESVIFDLGKG